MNRRQRGSIINLFIAKGKQYDNFHNFRKCPMKPNLKIAHFPKFIVQNPTRREGGWDNRSPNKERQHQNQAVWNRRGNCKLFLGQIIPETWAGRPSQ